MMKKILSVALSVIMVLSLIAVPGLAADPAPAAVEYTVSSVTYSAPSGGYFTASVDVTASTDSKVSVIFATLQDGELKSAKYITKPVGTSKETFENSADKFVFDAAYTYKVFVVETATGKAIAPEANYPTHENALAYVEVDYGNSDAEKLYPAENGTIILTHTAEREAAGNPTFKFVPVDNSSAISVEGGENFWKDKKTVTLTGLNGESKVYTVEADTIRLTFEPTVAEAFSYVNLGGQVKYQSSFDPITVVFGKETRDIYVDVPAGTTSVAMRPFQSGNVSIDAKTIVLSNDGQATDRFTIDNDEYTIHIRWDVNAPGIYNVTRNFNSVDRSFYLRANGKSLYTLQQMQASNVKGADPFDVNIGDALSGEGANMNITIGGTPLRNDATTLAVVTTDAETGNRAHKTNNSSIDGITGSWIKGREDNVWMKFTPTAAGTVYVRATQADALQADYKWNEITNEDGTLKDGWYVVTGAKLGNAAIKLFAKNFEKGQEVVIPTQKLDADEYNYMVNVKQVALSDFAATQVPITLPSLKSNAKQLYYRTPTESTKLYSTETSGYSAFTLICFNQNETDGGEDSAPALKTLSYKVGDGEATPITFAEGVTTATVSVPYGTPEVSLDATITGNGSVEYSANKLELTKEDQEGTLTVKVKQSDGTVAGEYTVTFEWADPVAPELATLSFTTEGGTEDIVLGENEFEKTIEVNFGTTNVSLDATITGDGSLEIGEELTLSEGTRSGEITVKILDADGQQVALYTIEFVWGAAEAAVLDALTYTIGSDAPVDIKNELVDNQKTVVVPYGTTGEVSLDLTYSGYGDKNIGESITLSADNRSGSITATLTDKSKTPAVDTVYTVNFEWAALTIESFTYTTALGVTNPADTGDHANGIDCGDGKKSIYAGGFYKPTVVPTATEAVVDNEAKTVVVTVPYGSEVVNLAAKMSNGAAIELGEYETLKMLNDNGAAKTFNVAVGEDNYAVTVKWADASDASLGVASTGADVYNVKYKYADLWATGNAAYKIVPTKLDLTFDFTIDESQYEEGQAPTEFAENVKFVADQLYKGNMFTQKDSTGYMKIARNKLVASSFSPWVAAGIIAQTSDLDNATLVNTGMYFTTNEPGSGTYAEMQSFLSFNVEAAGVVYVVATSVSTFTNDGTWTEVSAKTWEGMDGGLIGSLDSTVWVKNVSANEVVTIPVTITARDTKGRKNPIVIYDAGATFTPPVEEQPEENGGDVLAAEADSVNIEQSAGSMDITVSGSDANYKNEVVAVYVLAGGKEMSDLTGALASASGDLVGDGIILTMGKAWADENGNFELDLTLPAGTTTGEYNLGIITDTAKEVEDGLAYLSLNDQVEAYNAIVAAAKAGSGMGVAFDTTLNGKTHLAMVINTYAVYGALDPADKAVIQASVQSDKAVKDLPCPITTATATTDIVKLTEIIDARVAIEVFNNGDNANFATLKNYILDNATLTTEALALYEGDALNAIGKANVLAAITNKNFEVKEDATIQQQVSAILQEAAFVNLINNTAYTSANSVLPLVEKYDDAGVLVGTNGVAMEDVTLTALAEILNGTDITGYVDFADRVNALAVAPSEPLPPAPGDQTGGVVNDHRPSEGGSTSYPVGPTTKLLSSFSDANQAAWAATALQTMLDRNILSGYGDNTIRPNNSATRQEVAKMLVEAFSTVRPYAWTGFSDVPAGSWYYSYVATAAEDGIIKGVGEGKFGADANITREDLSVLIYRFLVNKGIAMNGAATRTFTDAASTSGYATEAINALTNAGIVNGYTDGSYNPKGNATRAEIAQIIANVLVIYAL